MSSSATAVATSAMGEDADRLPLQEKGLDLFEFLQIDY